MGCGCTKADTKGKQPHMIPTDYDYYAGQPVHKAKYGNKPFAGQGHAVGGGGADNG